MGAGEFINEALSFGVVRHDSEEGTGKKIDDGILNSTNGNPHLQSITCIVDLLYVTNKVI